MLGERTRLTPSTRTSIEIVRADDGDSERRPCTWTGGTLYGMAKRQEWNLPAMGEAELRALIAPCNRMEKALQAPHAKARRGWTELRGRAEAELAARQGERRSA
jgi:hypothetical protein